LSIVESQIIPRLLVSERIGKPHLTLVSSSKAMPSKKEIEIFTDLCSSDSSKDAQSFVDDLLNKGLSKEDIFLELITPAAQYLGSQWDDDRMDFSQVNLGLVRLHSIANEIRCTSKSDQFAKGKARRVMMASAPGSMHMLGTTIVADFFRKEDWQVVVAISSSANELVQTVSNEWFDVLGLSLSIDQQLTGLADLIDQLKSLSLNPRMVVMLGGPIFSAKKLDANDFGANGICDNAKHAVGLAVSLLPKD
jgi:methanogenic corrinoid protein MtbC1